MFEKKSHIVETYQGNEAEARKLFLKDAKRKAKRVTIPYQKIMLRDRMVLVLFW